MIRQPTRSTRTDTHLPSTTLVRARGTVGLQLLELLRRQRRDQLFGDSATQYHLVMRDLARLIGEFGAGATVVLGGRVELGESAMQVATALEQFALLGVVFDGDGVDRVILRIAQLQ